MSNVKAIKVMLRSFELVSGLKINFAKSCFGEVFVVDWAFSIGWASGREEIRYWSSNCIGALGYNCVWGVQ